MIYIVDITFENEESDILVADNSLEAKYMTINYLYNNILSNYGIFLDKKILDQNINMNFFSLKDFMQENNIAEDIDSDILIHNYVTDKDHCLFVKHFDKNEDSLPTTYIFYKNDKDKAKSLSQFLVNDSLLKKMKEKTQILKNNKNDDALSLFYNTDDFTTEIISLYNNDLFMEELLNNNISFRQLKYYYGYDKNGVDI